MVIEDCPKYGMTAKINAQWLHEQEQILPIIKPNGEVVIENGKEFIKQSEVKGPVKRKIPKKPSTPHL